MLFRSKGKAALIAQKASAYYISGDSEQADKLFKEALALKNDNWDVDNRYIYFLMYDQGFETALEYAKTRTSVYAEGTAERASLDSFADMLQQFVDILNNLPADNTTAPDTTPTTVPATTTAQ